MYKVRTKKKEKGTSILPNVDSSSLGFFFIRPILQYYPCKIDLERM